MKADIVRIFGVCTALNMVSCGLLYSSYMTKGPIRFLFRSLFVLVGCIGIYASLWASAANPWLALLVSIGLVGYVRQIKRARTNDPAATLSMRPGSKGQFQMEVKAADKTGS
jgi:hypothetical protein